MTTETTEAPRANRRGEPCPPWCITDHVNLIVADDPDCGFRDWHGSDAVVDHGFGRLQVSLYQSPAGPPKVRLWAVGTNIRGLYLAAEDADRLAGVLGLVGGAGPALADEVRAAAAIAWETR
jgi:hypothetical protein